MSPLPADSAERKTYPMCSGLLDYFPAALAIVANHSHKGNEKHNPGEPLHWARGKSDDHLDCAVRHILERDLAGAAWRILAALQMECEAKGAPVARGARSYTNGRDDARAGLNLWNGPWPPSHWHAYDAYDMLARLGDYDAYPGGCIANPPSSEDGS